ncbi:outer membrane receptor protein [Methylophilaceae bacterium 11]|nr:outer membrane receptor protein [Methylophilaceae bacterium 11]
MDILGAVHKTILAIVVVCVCWIFVQFHVEAAELNTKLPADQDAVFAVPVTVDIPSQPLAAALNQLGKSTNLNIAFPSDLVLGKTSPAVKGRMSRKEALQRILANSGLAAKIDEGNAYIEKASSGDKNIQLDQISVRAKRSYDVGPLPGLGLTKEEIPGNVQSITAREIKESHSLSIADLMNSKLQSVSVNDYQGNPFQMDVNYRGFTASPQLGTAQGISVFLDGIRVNEPFGDVVNWDMIPMNALSSLDIFPGSNPIFGLGTLGGALTMRTKSGFDGKSLDAEVLAGSYGRKQLQISAGGNNGVIAGFASGNFFLEDGWRDNSPSKVNQVFGKAEWQNERARLGLSMLYAGNKLTGNGLLPEQMAAENRSQVYTSPDESKNDLLQFQLSGIWDVSDTFNISGMVYHRNSKRKSRSTDVNNDFEGYATDRATGRQVLAGFQDINKDGLPDYNNVAYNVAADINGNPLDKNGNVCFDPNDPCINNLAIGTDFGTRALDAFGNPLAAQAEVAPANDGFGNPVVPGNILNWTYDPRQSPFEFTASTQPGVFNGALSDQFYQFALGVWKRKALDAITSSTVDPQAYGGLHPSNGFTANQFKPNPNSNSIQGANYTDAVGFYHELAILDVANLAILDPSYRQLFVGGVPYGVAVLQPSPTVPGDFIPIARDGGQADIYTGTRGVNPGYIDGTPTALITNTQIDQIGTGGSLQLNWNLDQHKFMVGGAINKADASYKSAEYLGLLDSKRNGAAAPDQLGYEFYARDKDHAISLNDFKGDSITKSLYASETWAPTKNLSITAAARYNYTTISNLLAVNRSSSAGAGTFFNILDAFTLCTDTNNNGVVEGTECPTGIPTENLISPIGNEDFRNRSLVGDARETFHYRSFNPALGATWQATEALNIYSNWNRGARTPTVIELGCALDDTLIPVEGALVNGEQVYQERSIVQRRNCNLPSTMAGDPYLKQVRSETFEVGARGSWTRYIEWNASVYRTDLQDDIYFVSVAPSRSFFQNIGDTRRQGIEMGFKGKIGKASFGLNYALTDATFQSAFRLDSPYNSSAGTVIPDPTNLAGNDYKVIDGKLVYVSDYQKIKVKSGNRMPGIPLHNLNANFSYELTDKWVVGLNAVTHSSAFVRGNENNKHKAGPVPPTIALCNLFDPNTGTTTQVACEVPHANYRGGKTPGYTVFNFQTSYKLSPEWTFGLLINNLFDKKYASAGRLGLNAFSPSINGAIGTSGFNYNSTEWEGASFLGLGAPRSAYVTLTYQFKPDESFD